MPGGEGGTEQVTRQRQIKKMDSVRQIPRYIACVCVCVKEEKKTMRTLSHPFKICLIEKKQTMLFLVFLLTVSPRDNQVKSILNCEALK